MACMERFDFSIAFQSFGGIRSTQPTMPQSVFLKLTPMVLLGFTHALLMQRVWRKLYFAIPFYSCDRIRSTQPTAKIDGNRKLKGSGCTLNST